MCKCKIKKLLKLADELGFEIGPKKTKSINKLTNRQKNTLELLSVYKHILVKAGRQTGKTTVITERIREFLNKDGLSNKTILLLTLNNRTKNNLFDTIGKIANEEYIKEITTLQSNNITILNKFNNTITIHIHTIYEKYRKISGINYNVLMIDEMGYMDEDKLYDFWEDYIPFYLKNFENKETLIISSKGTNKLFDLLFNFSTKFTRINWNSNDSITIMI